MINKIVFKGGAGSGNFGHRGRRGKRGGSASGRGGIASSGMVGDVHLPPNVNERQYIQARIWDERGIKAKTPIVVSADQLPSVPDGMTRFYHGTNQRNIKSIESRGILTGMETGSKERLSVILGTTDAASTFGDVSFASDLPSGKVHQVNSSWAEVGVSIPTSAFVGIVLGKMSVDSTDRAGMKNLFQAYDDWAMR